MRKMTIAQAHGLARYIRKVKALNEVIDMDNEYSIQPIHPSTYAKEQSVLGYTIKVGDKQIMLAPEQIVEVAFMNYHDEIRRLERQIKSLQGLQDSLDKAVAEFESAVKA